MEVQDLPAICKIAKQHENVVITDNNWATSVCYDVLKLGVDVSVQAVTKYIGGHADLMMGVATAGCERHFATLKSAHKLQGLYVGPDDINLAARGLRILRLSLERHMENGIVIAECEHGRKLKKSSTSLLPAIRGMISGNGILTAPAVFFQ